jgi:hypothetical protein
MGEVERVVKIMGRQKQAQSKTVIEKKPCDKCKIHKSLKDAFYAADETLHPDGRFHLCRDCVEDIISERGFSGLLMILRALNKPFLQDKYKDDYKSYLRQILSLPQYKGLTYEHSVFENKNNEINVIQVKQTDTIKNIFTSSYSEEELAYLAAFWGRGYTIEELEYLQTEYEKFLNSYECDSYAMELLFQEAAQQRLTIKKLREDNKSVDKELKTLQDLLGSANIKPAQETGANAVEQATFGTLIKKYENERPIPEPDEEWKDVDGIRKYISVWFLGHLSRMMGYKNENMDEYEEEINKYKVENPEYQQDEGDS